MTTPNFLPLTVDEFVKLVERYDFSSRVIDEVHMHHTWRPRHRDFRGLASILAMWKFHTEEMKWSDIAQHITIDPDGTIWTGRSWRLPPASSAGRNGNSRSGPFMFEMIGDFDKGQDVLKGAQLDTVIAVITAIQKANSLPPNSLKFHRTLGSPKTCPGSGIDYASILALVTRAHTAKATSRAAAKKKQAPASSVFTLDERRLNEALTLVSSSSRGIDVIDGGVERCEGEPLLSVTSARDGGLVERAPGARDARAELDAATLARLRPHVVNLVQGEFVPTGIFQTTREDVDALFNEHLSPRIAAATEKRPLRIVLWAHGGLVSERNGLLGALSAVDWWKANDVYPIFFIWETGMMETINQLVTRSGSRAPAIGARDLWDHTTDPVIETLSRPLGSRLWSGMKRSAERASASGGGAHYVATLLAGLVEKATKRVQVHAAGHSAGSIFHSHLIPVLLEKGVEVKSLHFAAPAVRIDTFLSRLGKDIKSQKRLRQFALYTMAKDWEKRDNCAKVYRKSLLYLVSLAFEAEGKAPILGLEEFVRRSDGCRELFGLDGDEAVADVVWSRSVSSTGRYASRSTTHSGFDEDPATMNSIMRRILEKNDVDAIEPYPTGRAVRELEEEEPLPPELAIFLRPEPGVAVAPAKATGAVTSDGAPPTGATGAERRFALCVGINEYDQNALQGCVADAEAWARTLVRRGFQQPAMLLDKRATRENILAELRTLVERARAGDVVVFQYAGHGTQLPDDSGDEDSDRQDEALCPVDYDDGNFVIDDDLQEVFAGLTEGVNLTCFFDCCHSGTITRLAARTNRAATGSRPRFLKAKPEQVKKHLAKRAKMGARRARATDGAMREISFTACRADQVAYESEGHGDFTRIATGLLDDLGNDTHIAFLERVLKAFGSSARQQPQLDCDLSAREYELLQAFSVGV